MIKNFRHRGLKRFYQRNDASQIKPEYVTRVRAILSVLDSAQRIEDVDLATYRLHALRGDWQDFWSVVVRANWRIVFRFEDGHARDVDRVDYH